MNELDEALRMAELAGRANGLGAAAHIVNGMLPADEATARACVAILNQIRTAVEVVFLEVQPTERPQ